MVQMCVKFNDEAMRKRSNLDKLTADFLSVRKVQRIIKWKNFYDIITDLFTNEQFRLHLFMINEKSGIGFDVIKISFERVFREIKPW